MKQRSIEQQVMASVGVIYTARMLVSRTALKVYALGASIWMFGALVWVARVEQNFFHIMNGGILAIGNFFLSAFMHTSVAVQVTALVGIVTLGSLAIDVVRSMTTQSRYSL